MRSTRRLVSGAALLLAVALTSCGDDDELIGNEDALICKRENGSTVQFSSARIHVWCGPWEEDIVLAPTLHVLCIDPNDLHHARWELQAVYADFSPGDTLRFPNTFIWDHPDSAHVFLYDPPNELSTDRENASGWIVFHQIPCRGASEVEFDINAILASELSDMSWVSMQGSLRRAVTGSPPWIGE